MFVRRAVNQGSHYLFKLSNKHLFFKWEQACVLLEDYRMVQYQVGVREGHGCVAETFPAEVEAKVELVRQFLRQELS